MVKALGASADPYGVISIYVPDGETGRKEAEYIPKVIHDSIVEDLRARLDAKAKPTIASNYPVDFFECKGKDCDEYLELQSERDALRADLAALQEKENEPNARNNT